MKSIIIYSSLLLAGCSVYAQNLIQNGGFEDGSRVGNCFTEVNQMKDHDNDINGLAYWKNALIDPDNCYRGFGGCTTSDWIDLNVCNGANFTAVQNSNTFYSFPVNTSNRMAGMVRPDNSFIEGVRSSLTQSLGAGKYYRLRLRMAVAACTDPRFNGVTKNAGVRVHFTKFGEYWNASTTLSSNVKWENVAKFVIPANSAHQWYEFTTTFRAPRDVDGGTPSDLGTIVIQRNDDDDDNTYIGIDDVELVEVDPCNNICGSPLLHDDLVVTCCGGQQNQVPDVHDGINLRPFNFIVANAMEIKFDVYNRWGVHIYGVTEYDPNHLSQRTANNDPNAPDDYMFLWRGKDDDGNFVTVSEVYVYTLSIKNCKNSDLSFSGNITVLSHLDQSIIDQIPPPQAVSEIKDCCPYQELINDERHINTAAAPVHAEHYISVGQNVPFEVQSSGSIEMTAGESIDVGPNFTAESGAEVELRIGDCVYSYGKTGNTRTSYNFKLKEGILDGEGQGLKLLPNPVSDHFSVILPQAQGDASTRVELYDVLGRKVKEQTFTGQQSGEIITDDLDNGCYIVKVYHGSSKMYTEKIIKK